MAGETLTVELPQEQPVEVKIDDVAAPASDVAPKIENTPAVEAPQEVEIKLEEQAAPAPPAPDEPDPISELKNQLLAMERRAEVERRGREAAEEEARQRAYEADRAAYEAERQRFVAMDAQRQAIVNAIHAEKADAEGLKRQLREASEAQDFDRIAEINMQLGQIGARLSELDEGRRQVEGYLRQQPRREAPPERQPPRKAAPPQPAADPVDAFIANLTPRSQTYIRNRDRSWVADERTNLKLRAAHMKAMAEGIEQDSDAYFAKIDDEMGFKKAEPKPAAAIQPKKPTAPAAPVTHKAASPAAANNTGGLTVKLSPRQVQAAKDLGISVSEYARRVHAMSQPSFNGPKLGQNS